MAYTSTAAVVREPRGEFKLEQVELDELRADEALVRVQAAGICHTDMEMQYVVPMPAVLGHEGAGIVEEVGSSVSGFKAGDRVIMSWPSCGTRGRARSGAGTSFCVQASSARPRVSPRP